jgi:sterol 3beta-glucosyltransferase
MHPDWLSAERLSEADIVRTNQEIQEILWRGKQAAVNELRASLGLQPAHSPINLTGPKRGIPMLNIYSSVVVPQPSDWGPKSVVTGYWQLTEQARRRLGESVPPQRLVDWLAAGPAPIFLGFGSMPILDPAPVVEMAVAAARQTGVRVLIGAGWTKTPGLADGLPDYVEMVDAVDHDWLFPQCLGVVHHGGSGTTGTGLTAGRPTFIFSLFLDQPYWGSRVTELGVGGHRRFPELGLDTLTEAMELLSREDIRENAAAIGRRLRQEDGLTSAIQLITDPANAIVPR